MSEEIDSSEEFKDLLRQVVASNLTVAYLLEQIRRERHPKEDEHHPLAQVLEVFEMIREIVEPGEEEDEDEGLEDLEEEALEDDEPRSTSARLKGTPFESTLHYLRPKKKRPDET